MEHINKIMCSISKYPLSKDIYNGITAEIIPPKVAKVFWFNTAITRATIKPTGVIIFCISKVKSSIILIVLKFKAMSQQTVDF